MKILEYYKSIKWFRQALKRQRSLEQNVRLKIKIIKFLATSKLSERKCLFTQTIIAIHDQSKQIP